MSTISVAHAKEIISRLSKLGANKYDAIVAAENDSAKKAKLRETAIGPRMKDLNPDEVILKDADSNGEISKDELFDSLNAYLKESENGGKELTLEQKDYLWSTTVKVIKDPGGSSTDTVAAANNESSSDSNRANAAGNNRSSSGSTQANANDASQPTDDKTAPILSSSKPSNNVAKVAIDSSIDLTFSENIKLADAGKVKLYEKSNGSEVEISTPVVEGKVLKIKPQAALKPNTKYYVKIDPGAVTDTSDNAYAGITTDSKLSFTTAEADDSKKKVVKPESKNSTLAKVLNNVIEGTVRIGTDVTASGTNTDRGASGTPDRTETGATQTRLNLEESSTSTTKSTNPNLTNLIKLRNALDILESDDVHITLTNYNYTENTEIGAINSALKQVSKQVSKQESVDNGAFRRYVFNQAVKDYKEIDAADANKASEYLSGEGDKLTKGNAEALTKVLTKYKEKYTALKDSVSEESLKNYFTDNYNDLNPLFGGRNGELPDPQSIKGLSKDALINLAITARNSLNSRIRDIKGKEASPDEYRALLSKYLGIKKDVPSMRNFIEGLNEEEFALYSSFRGDFRSKRYILGELSQHEMMDVAELGSSNASSYITPDTYDNFFKRYNPEEKDLNKQKEFINSLSIDELVLRGLSSKEELLKRVAGNTKNEQPLKDLLKIDTAADNLGRYLTNIQDPKSRIEKIDALDEKTKKILKEQGELYINKRGDIRLYDIGNSTKYIYVNKNGVTEINYQGLLGVNTNDQRAMNLYTYYDRLTENDSNIYKNRADNLLDVSENMRKLKSSAGVSTINQMLELIYKSEDQAKTDKSPTNWHSAMKKRIVDILLSKDEVELKTRMQEFKNYLNEADHAVNHIILGWYNQFQNEADAQTEALPSKVIRILNESVFQP